MKNSFCRICRGRFNLKYPPAAVDSENKTLSSRIIAVRIEENGEISENICWDCEDTLLGFNKSVGGDNEDEEEPVVVDDDEILYKSLEKTRRIHRTSKEIEIIQIDSSDSEHEERVTVPKEDETVKVEAANTIVECSPKDSVVETMDNKVDAVRKDIPNEIAPDSARLSVTRAKVVESMRCPLCPYLSGIEYEVVVHIRRAHPHYTGEHLNFEQKEGDPILTRRIIFVSLWTFFECKECGKIHDRFWPHRKHLTAHDRRNLKSYQSNCPTVNNIQVFKPHDSVKTVQTSKRALDSLENIHQSKQPKFEERVLRRTSKDNSASELKEKPPADSSKTSKKHQRESASKKSSSKALLRKQQLLQAKREKRLQKQKMKEMKKMQTKSKKTPKTEVIPKPTFKMPQLPAPRASSVVKQLSHHPKFTCKLCSQILGSFINWNTHMLRVHSEQEFKNPITTDATINVCRKCDKNFSNAHNLRMHVRLSHRRKNRLVEINGNDDEEVCRQTLTPKKESKEEAEDRLNISLPNGVSKAHKLLVPASSSALLCQYCGMLFSSLVAMRMHETAHITDADVKRIFKIKPQA